MTSEGFLFELSGGALCLDFVNTRESPAGHGPVELLGGYDDLVAWGEQSKAITAEQAKSLRRAAGKKPRDADAAVAHARTLREGLFTLFSERAAGRPLPPKALEALDAEARELLAHQRLARGEGGRAIWTFTDELPLERILWPVVRSATEVVTSDELDRLRECASESCRWLFLDRSKNASRRWCDMTTCGNRDKVRRHRQRADEGD